MNTRLLALFAGGYQPKVNPIAGGVDVDEDGNWVNAETRKVVSQEDVFGGKSNDLYERPSVGMRIFNPQMAAQVDQANMQYQQQPFENANRLQMAKKLGQTQLDLQHGEEVRNLKNRDLTIAGITQTNPNFFGGQNAQQVVDMMNLGFTTPQSMESNQTAGDRMALGLPQMNANLAKLQNQASTEDTTGAYRKSAAFNLMGGPERQAGVEDLGLQNDASRLNSEMFLRPSATNNRFLQQTQLDPMKLQNELSFQRQNVPVQNSLDLAQNQNALQVAEQTAQNMPLTRETLANNAMKGAFASSMVDRSEIPLFAGNVGMNGIDFSGGMNPNAMSPIAAQMAQLQQLKGMQSGGPSLGGMQVRSINGNPITPPPKVWTPKGAVLTTGSRQMPAPGSQAPAVQQPPTATEAARSAVARPKLQQTGVAEIDRQAADEARMQEQAAGRVTVNQELGERAIAQAKLEEIQKNIAAIMSRVHGGSSYPYAVPSSKIERQSMLMRLLGEQMKLQMRTGQYYE